ncbi:small ubiquitin-related modifier 5-like [Teleopsis dalmanni]|uniref:small ubiquitin-related modifier 5-like n=1 Tax=Teleopsis dalmanni TaxID=139649 RepID=UPI0018CF06A2|nr:small ubiquitin-related modifier 5-like [Teleopsis dalmanni]
MDKINFEQKFKLGIAIREGKKVRVLELVNDPVILTVLGVYNYVMKIQVPKCITFGDIIKVYCRKMAIIPENHRFFYMGERLKNEATPFTMNINDGAIIEVYSTQIGGGMESY